jgi:hypothetical protein
MLVAQTSVCDFNCRNHRLKEALINRNELRLRYTRAAPIRSRMFIAPAAIFFRLSVRAQECSAPPELQLTRLPRAINISPLRGEVAVRQPN